MQLKLYNGDRIPVTLKKVADDPNYVVVSLEAEYATFIVHKSNLATSSWALRSRSDILPTLGKVDEDNLYNVLVEFEAESDEYYCSNTTVELCSKINKGTLDRVLRLFNWGVISEVIVEEFIP